MAAPADLVVEIEALGEKLVLARDSIAKQFIGQKRVVDLTLAALVSGGHALLVGLPGLGKTRLVNTLGTVMGLDANRVQFTPDLMPADILGSEVLDTAADGTRAFRFVEGPVFCQLLMADEINRASPRTQSALLQAMQEREVTIAGQHRPLGKPFHVLATQNPLEQEGTYPLPEAQLDRFLLQIDVPYPTRDVEREILLATTGATEDTAHAVFTADELIAAQAIRQNVAWGPGPRAAQALMLCARAEALMNGRLAPSPEDVRALAAPVLSHRMALSFAARARGENLTSIIDTVSAQITKVEAAA